MVNIVSKLWFQTPPCTPQIVCAQGSPLCSKLETKCLLACQSKICSWGGGTEDVNCCMNQQRMHSHIVAVNRLLLLMQ